MSNNTIMTSDTDTPDEHDPCWDELGKTRIVPGQLKPEIADTLSNPTENFTEISPSRILGKNLVTLGDFQLKRKIGEGAMGAVYKALQISADGDKLETPRTVALKILFSHVANNPKLVERLYREGLAMGQLDHPNIIQAYAIGEAEGCHYIAMEYVSGQSMQKWLAQLGKLTVGDALAVTLECARALSYAHSLNMIHRDIKPDNILVTRNGGIVKVADLGMVKTHDEDMSLTQTGHAVGTPWYMPLEQAKNAKEIDGRSDIYALGCTLYALLTGSPPFTGRTIVDVIQAKEIGTFPPARQTNRDVPERLELILLKMIAKQPRNRYQSCAEVIKDLENLGLANRTLAFLQEKPAIKKDDEEETVARMLATEESTVVSTSSSDSPSQAPPEPDENTWYLRVKAVGGKTNTRKYTTSQLQNMLADGKLKPNGQISHHPTDQFRAVATYKEFQGAVLAEASKKRVDKHTARNRGIYSKILEHERQREEKERDDKRSVSHAQATTQYWLGVFLRVLPYGLGIIFIIMLIWLAARSWS